MTGDTTKRAKQCDKTSPHKDHCWSEYAPWEGLADDAFSSFVRLELYFCQGVEERPEDLPPTTSCTLQSSHGRHRLFVRAWDPHWDEVYIEMVCPGFSSEEL